MEKTKKEARVVNVSLELHQIGVQMRSTGNTFGYQPLLPVNFVTSTIVP